MNTFVLIALVAISSSQTDEPTYEAEQIFPPVETQTHAPGIVECSNGDLIASWYGDLRPGRFRRARAPGSGGVKRPGARRLSWRIGRVFRTATRP